MLPLHSCALQTIYVGQECTNVLFNKADINYSFQVPLINASMQPKLDISSFTSGTPVMCSIRQLVPSAKRSISLDLNLDHYYFPYTRGEIPYPLDYPLGTRVHDLYRSHLAGYFIIRCSRTLWSDARWSYAVMRAKIIFNVSIFRSTRFFRTFRRIAPRHSRTSYLDSVFEKLFCTSRLNALAQYFWLPRT